MSRVIKENHVVCCYNYLYGPTFGVGNPIIFYNVSNTCYCSKNSYEKPIRKTKNPFYVDECEVFKLYKTTQ